MKMSEAFEGENSSLKKTFDECCEGEELKKEWERDYENIFINYNDRGDNIGMYLATKVILQEDIRVFISSLLAKQQEDNQKIIDGIFEIKEKELARQREEFVKTEQKYQELILAVVNRYEGETRHETALRYIIQAEKISPEANQIADIKSKLKK
jgi:hypothetical protein